MPIQLILVRHTSLDIQPDICYGQSDIDVSASFIEEATIVKEKLQQFQANTIYTSPSQRCTKLADFCGFPKAIRDQRLLELNFGDWENQKWDEIDDPNLALWYEDWIDTSTTNGESFQMQYARYCDFISTLTAENNDQTVIVFTHSGILHCARIQQGIDTFKTTFDHKFNYGEVLAINLQN